MAAAGASTQDRLVAAWLRELQSDRTRDAYGRDLAAFARWCAANGHEVLEVGVDELTDYRDDRGDEGVAPATVARRLSALASFFDHAVMARVAGTNPVTAVRRPAARPATSPPRLQEHEAGALLAAAGDLGPKVLVLVALLLVEGLKLAETLALNVEELDVSGPRMQATLTRRGRSQSIELDARTARAIRAHLAGRTEGPLLVGESPTRPRTLRLTRFGADFLLKQAAAGAGLGPVSANTLRRTHIARAHRGGTTVAEIADRVGHANPRETRRYLP